MTSGDLKVIQTGVRWTVLPKAFCGQSDSDSFNHESSAIRFLIYFNTLDMRAHCTHPAADHIPGKTL
jgi:hypothetical protein